MTESLRALLTGVIDYAGLFPPAALPLEQAIRNYARYRTEPESWMLGNFVCPVGKLSELAPFLDLFAGGPPLRLAVLGSGSGGMLHDAVRNDIELLASFRERYGECADISSYELKLFGDLPERKSVIVELATIIEDRLQKLANECFLPPTIVTPFFEPVALESGAEGLMRDLREAHVPAKYRHCRPAGLKLRCGGVEPRAFPSADSLADWLYNFPRRASSSPLARPAIKFTAGLHHPIRRFDPGLGVKMHGFINVFVTGVLCCVQKMSMYQIQSILEDEKAGHFRFDDEAVKVFHEQNLSATVEQIAAARRFVTSFGSCSFDEPRDDLRRLGWL